MHADTVLRFALGSAGVGLIAFGVIWRFRHRSDRVHELARELASPDPAVRALVAGGLVNVGLDRTASILLDHIAHEPATAVKLSIAIGVSRRQWEPAGIGKVMDLRLWASRTLELYGVDVQRFGPALTRLADMGGPRRPDYVPPQVAPSRETATPQPAPYGHSPVPQPAPPSEAATTKPAPASESVSS